MSTSNRNYSTSQLFQNDQDHQQVSEAWGNTKGNDGKKEKDLFSVDDIKYAYLMVYVKEILKSSLITSIPEIAESKSWPKKIIKILVFVLCVIGFIYQTLDFLWLYMSYPTAVNVLISNPFEIMVPAITICNRNRLRRSFVCADEEGQCIFLDDVSFCKTYPRSCPTSQKIFTGAPFINSMILKSNYWEDELEGAHNESMIQKCLMFIEGEEHKCKKPYRQVPAVMSSGDPNMCYTIGSLWGKPDEEPAIHSNTFMYEVTMCTQPDEYITYTEPILIQIAIHDARKLVNPFTEGYSLKGGVQYDATVSMTEKKLLPPPFDTNCTDYIKLWKENNGTGPLNDLTCVEYCKLNTVLEKEECIDKNVYYSHMEELCDRGVTTTTSDIIESCTKSCGKPCRDYTYDVRYEAVNNYDSICKDDWCRVSRTKVTLYFNQFRVTSFQYQPKFESVEMFSYIGGYMGMWLGLSLVSLFDFIETIVYLFYYPVGHFRWKMKNKK